MHQRLILFGLLLHSVLPPEVRATSTTAELKDSFYSNVVETRSELSSKTGAILFQSDLMYWSIMDGSGETTRYVDTPDFSNFMALSHAPVTMATILLPDLLRSGYTLSSGIRNTTQRRLEVFKEVLQATKGNFSGTTTISVANDILTPVSEFVDDILSNQSTVTMQKLQSFASGLEKPLRRAAEMAVEDYFMRLAELTNQLNRGFNWSVVVAVEGFSYNNSFIHQFYERVFFEVLFGRSDYGVQKRIALVPGGFCNNTGTLTDAASNQIYTSEIYRLFNYGSTIHSILSDAADKVICSQSLSDYLSQSVPGLQINCPVAINFTGFQTVLERVFVILVVTFFSVAVFLLILVVSIFSEDRVIKRENSMDMPKKKKKKKKKSQSGPNLLEPISDFDRTSNYIGYRELKKKHTNTKSEDSCHSPVENGFSKVSRRSRYSQFHNVYGENNGEPVETRPRGVTHTDVTSDDLTEC